MGSTITPILVAMLTGGLLAYIRDLFKWMHDRNLARQPDQVELRKVHDAVATADRSVLVVEKSRDALEDDNARLRAEIQEMALRHAADRLEWYKERGELRQEIDALEDRLRATLADVRDLRERHGMAGEP
jgi:FtsZ-binding cell division protein ZapB